MKGTARSKVKGTAAVKAFSASGPSFSYDDADIGVNPQMDLRHDTDLRLFPQDPRVLLMHPLAKRTRTVRFEMICYGLKAFRMWSAAAERQRRRRFGCRISLWERIRLFKASFRRGEASLVSGSQFTVESGAAAGALSPHSKRAYGD